MPAGLVDHVCGDASSLRDGVRMPRSRFLLFRRGENLSDLEISPDDLQIAVSIKIARVPEVAIAAVLSLCDAVKIAEEQKNVTGSNTDVLQIGRGRADLPESREPACRFALPTVWIQVGVDVTMDAVTRFFVFQIVQKLIVRDAVAF